jgi:hypothetical protein
MSFSDLLKKPLPSKLTEEVVATESTEEVEEVKDVETESGEPTTNPEEVLKDMDTEPEAMTEDSDEDIDDEIEDLDDIDLSNLSDEELEEMEAELRDSDLDDAAGDVEPVELSPEEEREADDLMSLAGTTELIRSELNADEQNEFFESAQDMQIAVFEGFLFESDILPEMSDEEDVLTEKSKIATKNRIFRTADSWKAMLYAIAVNVSARAHNDPDFIKLQKVQKMRRVLRRKLQKKYHGEAVKRMKIYFNRLKASKSPILAKLGKKVDNSGE